MSVTSSKHSRTEVEQATLTWVDWYNNRRLLERLGHMPPAEAEQAYYASPGVTSTGSIRFATIYPASLVG